jgi:hypothetical protein
MIRLFLFIAAVVLMAMFLTGNLGGGPLGPPPRTSIAELFDEPGRWDGEHVRVTGQVRDRVAILGFGGFTLRDQLGKDILVVGAATPAGIGQSMTVSGRFMTAFALRDVALPVILVETE